MNIKKLSLIGLLVFCFQIKSKSSVELGKVNLQKIPFQKLAGECQILIENNLILKIELVDGKRLLRVSFNGNEGSDGTLKIYDDSKKLVIESNFELIKYPYYATVDITNLAFGKYTASLITKQNIHTSVLTIN